MNDYIQLTNISKTFGKQTVLQPLTMGFEEGMIHGIIGRNGSGKTVLMKMILGILQPIEFIPYMSAYQNLADIAAMRGNLSKTQIKEVLEMVGLGNVGRKHVSKFSMGMRQRLAIAQAVMESPKLLILDEPMNGMDEKGVEEMRQLILARKAAGTTIILSSHNIEDIRILCDQVYRIDAGVVMRK